MNDTNATVFYAWQSDRPRKVTRDLIRGAAEAACKRITEDDSNSWSLTLDSDTQGEAGMCDIPNTILEKIKKCDMFLADLTFVGKTDHGKDEQLMLNSNVLFELGFAASCLGFDSLIGVINEAYGSIRGKYLILSGDHRYPIQRYRKPPIPRRSEENRNI